MLKVKVFFVKLKQMTASLKHLFHILLLRDLSHVQVIQFDCFVIKSSFLNLLWRADAHFAFISPASHCEA